MKFNPTFQIFRKIKATMAISFAVYGAVVLVAGHGGAHHGWCAIAIAVALSLGALHKVGQIAEEIRNLHELRLELIREKLNAT
jgi:hypothetical protein